MGSCFQLSFFSGPSCFCWLCPSCCLPFWVPMPKATVMYQLNPTATTATLMYQLNPTATTATLCLMVTSQDTVTMAMQHPTDTSPEPDMDTMATLYLMSHMQHPMVMSQEPDMDTMATLYLMVMSQEPDMDTMATLYLIVTSQDTVTMAMQHPMDMSPDTATLPMSPDMATLHMSPDMATTATLRMSPDTVTTGTLPTDISQDIVMDGRY